MDEEYTGKTVLNSEKTGKIDYLIGKGLYPNRADFLKKAIESQLNLHDATFQDSDNDKTLIIGVAHFSAKDLEAVVAKGKKLEIRVLGLAIFSENISSTLIEKSVSKMTLAGILKAPAEVKTVLNKKRFTVLGQRYSDFKSLESKANEDA